MRKKYFILVAVITFILASFSCGNGKQAEANVKATSTDSLTYLNHSDSAKYVGINTCRQCHSDIYNSFIKTGMGKSFGLGSKEKSSGDFSNAVVHDKFSDLHYQAFWYNDSLHFMEFVLKGKDTSFKRIEQVNYIIGSGQHTNSHLQSVNGYVNQMPLTFYTQKKKWDMPPGFEEGHNTRFTRKIGLECMSCHNAFPDFVMGSENKYRAVPVGIDCERCHGPGSVHVAQRSTEKNIDTSKYIDYSIVNPAKLSIEKQFDLCQRCHLQGNAVLKQGKSFYDFKPGMKLSDYITVFLPKYENADDEFIMASHADRLKQSKCFISTSKQSNPKALKPYKEALTCVTCHNPHVSVKETKNEIFNAVCGNCHGSGKKFSLDCSEKTVIKFRNSPNSQLPTPNCVNCHMPLSGSIDIPHVTVHDHYIRKPIAKQEKEKLKKFLGIFAINEKNPDKVTKAKAYINYYDKFDAKPSYLDTALFLLGGSPEMTNENNIHLLIQLYFSKQYFSKLIACVKTFGEEKLFTSLKNISYDNSDAWTAYRIGETFSYTGDEKKSLQWMKRACELAPYNLEFRNKLGSVYMSNADLAAAKKEFEFVLNEHPKNISALTNLGYLELTQNHVIEAEKLYARALKLDASYEPLLMNIAGLKAFQRKYEEAREIMKSILKKNPNNVKAKSILDQLSKVK